MCLLIYFTVYVDVKFEVKGIPVHAVNRTGQYTGNIIKEVKLTRQEEWNIGPCTSVNIYPHLLPYGEGKLMRTFVRSCWFEPGQHVLECYSKDYSSGWTYAHVEIQGHRYCDDFVSIKALRKITIEGYFC